MTVAMFHAAFEEGVEGVWGGVEMYHGEFAREVLKTK